MKKAVFLGMAAVVVHPKSGKEFGVRHQIDVQEWLDQGYTLKGVPVDPEPKKDDPESGGDLNDTTSGKDPEPKENTGPMTQEEFDLVKGNLAELNAEPLRRVAIFIDVPYTNKKETLIAIEAKISDDL